MYAILATVVLFIFVLPCFLAAKKVVPSATSSNSGDGSAPYDVNQVVANNDGKPEPASKIRNKRRNGKKEKDPQPIQSHQSETKGTKQSADEVAVEFSPLVSNILTLLCIIVIFAILFFSDNNLFPARTVLLAPVFTKEECKHIIDMAHAAAERNAKNAQKERELLLVEHPGFMDLETTSEQNGYDANNVTAGIKDPHLLKLNRLDNMLKEPAGWKKDRHTHYPTTDLNVVTDPFTPEDRAWLANKLNARLAPLVERSLGIFRGAIRANDIFVMRWQAMKKKVVSLLTAWRLLPC